MDRTALVVGATGIAGYNTAQALVAAGWRVVGLSRKPRYEVPGVEHVHGDVLDPESVEAAIAGTGITHLFFTTWSRQDTEAQNCAVNGAMLANTIEALRRTTRLQHAVLITGLKHYLGPFEAYAAAPAETPFRESQDRLPFQNFYYDQEDILFAAAAEQGFTWSVHRPHTMIGYALGNAMNMGVTLAVYGSICRATGEPFVFPGSPQQYGGVTDITDARLLGRHAVWSATEPAARNQAFNTTNGDVFRWRQMWTRVAEGLGRATGRISGIPHSAGRTNGPGRRRMGRTGRETRSGRLPGLRTRILVAHRRRSQPRGRDVRRHGQEPGARLPRLPGLGPVVPRPVRHPSRAADHPAADLRTVSRASLVVRRR